MSIAPLFDERPPFDRERLEQRLRELAASNVLIGTSSWKYPGWLGQIYSPERYMARGAFSQKRFEAECLAEYARTFPVVCGDFTFYQFPTETHWRKLFGSAPETLGFAFKAPEEITARVFPLHPRYGARGGTVNRSFLDTELLVESFLKPLEPYRDRVGTLIFEFGAFAQSSYASVRDFAADLDRFLVSLPRGYRYAVEIRNPEFLAPDYFACLARHNAAHVFNAWTRMPELGAQIAIPDAFTADFTVCRALLRRGRAYADAVKLFSPYEELQDPNPASRDAIRELIEWAQANRRAAFIYVNNRFEGNAPRTVEALVS
ncbi:MAG TPA: DUF72 domain-containing protein [Bryobacteraceae bacterium]|nr:DUF72 domain-containing protein [Bryobacteraceae bacterium]